MQQSDVSGVELMARVARALIQDIETVMPGKVLSYDDSEDSPRAVVRLSIQGHRIDGEEDVENYEMGHVSGPVVHFGGGGNTIYTPLVAGDDVLVLTISRDIDNAVGNAALPAVAGTTRRHHIMDAMIIPAPWLGVGSASRTSTDPGAMVLDGLVQLGAGTGQVLTTAQKVLDRLTAIETFLNVHEHPNGNLGGPTGSPTTTVTPTVITDVQASTDIKVKV
tara:strand:- start:1241 stop:1903 length:663 start_codon:yes stop_codon:yes gene_type:complete